MNPHSPFGPPAFLTEPQITRVPIAECLDPAAFHRRFRGQLPVGEATCLLESSDAPAGSPARSLIATCCPLRLELRNDAFLVVPLQEGAAALLDALRTRHAGATLGDDGALRIPVVDSSTDWTLADAERLQAADCLEPLRQAAGLIGDRTSTGQLPAGLFGVFGYEIVDRFDALPVRRPDPLDEPDASFVLALDSVVFEHVAEEVVVTTREIPGQGRDEARRRHEAVLGLLRDAAPAGGDAVDALSVSALSVSDLSPSDSSPSDLAEADTAAMEPAASDVFADVSAEILADVAPEAFADAVRTVQDHILAGDVFQTVLSRGFAMESPAASLDVYAALRRSNPSPYMFHFDLAEGCVLGASPETFLKVDQDGVEIRPIAGTVPRGEDAETDQRLALQLRLDAKEQAEHAMLLDLARNDVARIAQPGTMRVEQQFEVERYSHVQHLVSRVRGQLRSGLDALHAYRAVANMGTLTGAPKLRAMELIRELERTSRGFYGGAAGYLLQDGRFDSCIVIRSLRHRDGRFLTRAGAGVVHASQPARERAETEHKARACIAAVAAATVRQGVRS